MPLDIHELDIHEITGPLRVLAGPGTGKTHALVDLYEQAVREGVAGRDQILVLTFSTGAAGEIARRIDERLQDDYGEAWISTFHSFCARILRDYAPDRDRLLINGFQEWIVMRKVLSDLDEGLLGPLAGVRSRTWSIPHPSSSRRRQAPVSVCACLPAFTRSTSATCSRRASSISAT